MSVLVLNAFTVFLAIAAVGFLFLMISLFFGGIVDQFEGGFDTTSITAVRDSSAPASSACS